MLAEDPVAASRLAPSIPRDLEAICLKCLEKVAEPALRLPPRPWRTIFAASWRIDRSAPGDIGPLRRAWKFAAPPSPGDRPVRSARRAAVDPHRAHGWSSSSPQREIRQKAVEQAPIVREILRRNCYACHGQDVKDVRKSLDILNHRQLLDSARRIVVPGAPEDSRLIQRIADGSMPPEEEELHLPRVSETDLQILKDWILGGAPPFAPADAAAADLPAPPRSDSAAAAKAIFRKHCYKCHKFDVAKGGIKIMHHRLLVTGAQGRGPRAAGELGTVPVADDRGRRRPHAPRRRIPALAGRGNRDHSQVDPRRAPPFPKN